MAKEQVENAKGPVGLAPESKGTEGEDGPPADGAEGKGGPPASGAEGKDKPATVSAPCAARQHPQILDDTELSMPQPRQRQKRPLVPVQQLVRTLPGEALLTHRHLLTGSWLRRTYG